MSKLTTMILALLMLASTSLVALDWNELDQKENNLADGRAGPDAQVDAILSPRETTTDDITGDMRNTIKAGDDVNFEVFISNVGDAAITEMGVSVTVYLTEGGARGMIAKDAAGNDLSWTNGDLVCDDSFVCPWSSLDAGAYLDNGKHTMTYQGSDITWTPTTGDYIVVVETNAVDDAEPSNDFAEHYISVVEWTDIIIDLEWTSGKDVESGAEQKHFTLTVETGGSTAWSARSIIVALDIEGTLESANPALGTSQVTDLGSNGTIETFRHEIDANNTTTDSRFYLDFGDSTEYFGSVSPDSTASSGSYTVSASLVSYVVYGQMPECVETTTTGGTNATNGSQEVTYLHFCEVSMGQDDDASTSEDEIEGQIENFHDIGIAALVINQGYSLDETGNHFGTPTMPGLTSGPLNPAWGSVQATVRHLGSSLSTTYDWEVAFSIENTVTGVVTNEVGDSCIDGFGQDYFHQYLGDDPQNMGAATETGQACIFFNFAPGVYNISATISMVNETVTDMSSSNNEETMTKITAMNNRPTVALTLETEGDLVLGPGASITLVADADDADDDSGTSLSYRWNHPGIPDNASSFCDGSGPEFSTCNLLIDMSHYAGVHTYSVVVIDAFGSTGLDFINVFVWNQITASSTSASGVTMDYNLSYNGVNTFSLTIEDSDAEYTQDLTSHGFAGEYTSELILDYTPSTTYGPEDVLAQDITISYDATAITPTSVFYISNSNWAKLDATISSSGNDGTILIDMGENNPVLSGGEIALMGGEIQIIEASAANPSGLTMSASAGGHITAAWGYTGTTVTGVDWLEYTLCDDVAGSDCHTQNLNTTTVDSTLNGQTDTVHGVTYTLTLRVCNGGGCNPTVATASATADNSVDGDATATAMSVTSKDANTWTVSWTVSGDEADVDHWQICWGSSSWDVAGDMPTTCSDAATTTSGDVNKPGGNTQMYFFTAVPVDALGNSNNDVSMTDIKHTVDVTLEDCESDPTLEGCDEKLGDDPQGDAGVPTWTWGVIIGLVVVAFVVGAFILSRGGEGEEGKDWDY